MLILTRKEGETITFGEKIQVKDLNVKGGQVRIGIDAPRDVSVNREEVLQRTATDDSKTPLESPAADASSTSD